jgi:P27 family predicted phage terminase small subunit
MPVGRGRPRDPTPLKVLKGRSNGTDQAGYQIPEPPAFDHGVPVAPDWLEPEAREVWDRVAPSLDRLDLLKPDDRENFAAYCMAWSRFVAASKTHIREGMFLKHKNGVPFTNPAVREAEQAAAQLLRLAQQFGLTPAAEINLAKPRKAVTSDNDKFGGDSAAAAS